MKRSTLLPSFHSLEFGDQACWQCPFVLVLEKLHVPDHRSEMDRKPLGVYVGYAVRKLSVLISLLWPRYRHSAPVVSHTGFIPTVAHWASIIELASPIVGTGYGPWLPELRDCAFCTSNSVQVVWSSEDSIFQAVGQLLLPPQSYR